MRLAIYGRTFNDQAIPYVRQFFDLLERYDTSCIIYDEFKLFLEKVKIELPPAAVFSTAAELSLAKVDCLLSLGGDGTLLDTVNLIRDSGLPVLGINLGRLGFLASINKNDLELAMQRLHALEYTIDSRTMIRLDSDKPLFSGLNYGLNECTIHKTDSSSMIIVHTYLDNEFLNSYWADGLIISTPAGSTAYSLSCGGPIVFPGCQNFVITPIAPHNLNVRPLVINDDHELSFVVEGRKSQFLVSLDSRTQVIDSGTSLRLKKENFKLNLLRLNSENYLTTLRDKLMWGLDSRN